MAYRSFSVGPTKGLKHAAFDEVPNLAVIAGPNGAGKSTLLHQLWQNSAQAEPGTQVIYVGPHRTWRKSVLSGAALYSLNFKLYRDLLAMHTFPSWQNFAPPGLQYITQDQRLPDSSDEAQSLVKISIVKLDLRQLQVLRETYEAQGHQVREGTLPDVFEPLRNLTRYLLPHLEFERVDGSNEQNFRVLFRRVDGDENVLIDIDELSSGEKAVIALFFPFLEIQVERLLTGSATEEEGPMPAALIDEPDLHLHPTLQVSLIDYLRDLADSGEAQFIITTHSPTILDSLRDDELFLLAPVGSVGDGNQFLRVTTSEERLETIRSLTGSTHLLTRCRPIVFLEGVRPREKPVSDQRLVEELIPESAGWVLVAASGRRQAIESAKTLREAATESLPEVPVFALVDADQVVTDDPDYAISWPVAMVENLLLDSEAMWDVLSPFREKIPFSNHEQLQIELKDIARNLAKDETRLRVLARVKPFIARLDVREPERTGEGLQHLREEVDRWIATLGGESKIRDIISASRMAVEAILSEGRELEAFRGKEILRDFYERHVKGAGFGYKVFVYQLAMKVRERTRLRELVEIPVLRIQRYIPPELVPVLEGAQAQLPEQELRLVAESLEIARRARSRWEHGEPDDTDRDALRASLVQIARLLHGHGYSDLHRALLQATVQVGTG